MNKLKAWSVAIRPKTLSIAVSPVLLGSSVAFYESSFRFLNTFIALICSIMIQIIANLVNDYYDFLKGSDTSERVGPQRATASGLVSQQEMKKGILVVTIITIFLGAFLVYITDLWILWIGLISIFFAFIYTAGPFSLAYHGLGELFAFLFFGPIAVVGSYYCNSLSLQENIFWMSIPTGCIAAAILMTNNIRDHSMDKKAGKNTLVVILGLPMSKIFYAFLFLPCFIVPVYLIDQFGYSILLPFFLLKLIIQSIMSVFRNKQPFELNKTLEKNALFLLLYNILFVLGLFININGKDHTMI